MTIKWNRVLAVGLCVVAGMAGMGAFLALKHVWMDHMALHELAVIELQRQQAAPRP
jgi:uncharacterized membrane protein YoaK (UPF0700 family)